MIRFLSILMVLAVLLTMIPGALAEELAALSEEASARRLSRRPSRKRTTSRWAPRRPKKRLRGGAGAGFPRSAG